MQPLIQIFAAAAFVFQSAAAGAGSVFADSAFSANGVALFACACFFGNLFALDFFIFANANTENCPCGFFSYRFGHCVETVTALIAVFLNRVVMTVCHKSDSFAHFIHCVDVFHPMFVNGFQEYNPFNLAHKVVSELVFAFFIDFVGFFFKAFCNLFFRGVAELFGREAKVVVVGKPTPELFTQAVKIPVIMHIGVAEIAVARFVNAIVNHIHNCRFNIFSVKNLVALFINKLALAVHNIVVFEHGFADFKVAAFNLALCAFN